MNHRHICEIDQQLFKYTKRKIIFSFNIKTSNSRWTFALSGNHEESHDHTSTIFFHSTLGNREAICSKTNTTQGSSFWPG